MADAPVKGFITIGLEFPIDVVFLTRDIMWSVDVGCRISHQAPLRGKGGQCHGRLKSDESE